MATLHSVLRYLLERVPHSTQDEHDRIAALIDQDDPSVDTPQDHDETGDEKTTDEKPSARKREQR